jgi:hypothetical protein
LHPQLKPELLPGFIGTVQPAKPAADFDMNNLFSSEEYTVQPQPAEQELIRLQRPAGQRVPSVLVFMIDATSRAHFRRSLPKTLAVLERMALGRGVACSSGPGWLRA